jgi:sugar lactone lactonase YvrE
LKIVILNPLMCIACSLCMLQAQAFHSPESAAYDSVSKRLFVSNYGDGTIIQIDTTGEQTIFQQGLSNCLGMILSDRILYVVDSPKTILGYDICSGELRKKLTIEQAQSLNDLTRDSSGWFYVTDIRGNGIYKTDPDLRTYTCLLTTRSAAPNGILYDPLNHRLLVCFFHEKAPIHVINLKDLATTVIQTEFDNLDGLTMDLQGNVYVSYWGAGSFSAGFPTSGSIYRYDNQFAQAPVLVSTGHHGPADIYFNPATSELVIPNLLDNTIQLIPCKPEVPTNQ